MKVNNLNIFKLLRAFILKKKASLMIFNEKSLKKV